MSLSHKEVDTHQVEDPIIIPIASSSNEGGSKHRRNSGRKIVYILLLVAVVALTALLSRRESKNLNLSGNIQQKQHFESSHGPGGDKPSTFRQNVQRDKKSVSGIPLHAAEALQCRESVVSFVVYATDVKDECEGLRKAFDKTCSGNSFENQVDDQQRQRRIEQTKNQWNPVKTQQIQWIWQYFSYNRERSAKHTRRQNKRKHSRRQLDETSPSNKSKTVLDLPTSFKHISDKTASESFLLHSGEKMFEMAANHSAAAKDAAASSKAISDTDAAISSILNDPSSVEARTCCASILNVYHENCSTDDEEQISDSRLFFVVFVMAMCGMVKSLIRHYRILWLPEAAGCILVGVLSGYLLAFFPHHDLSFDGNWFLRIMVPPIIFEAAVSIDKRSFNRHLVPILMYAVVGTLFATFVTAFVLHRGTLLLQGWCTPIPYVEALTFGALISSIDPIAVLSVLSNMGMTDTDTLYVIVFGESLLNDGVAIVLFQTLEHFLDENLVIDSEAIMDASIHFLVVAIGSFLVGVASGMLSTVYYYLFYGCQTPLVEILMFSCWALLPYYVCDGMGWSGIVAAVAAGFMMDLYIIGETSSPDLSNDSAREYGRGQSRSSTPSKNSFDKSGENRSTELGRRAIFSPEGHLSMEARIHIHFVTEILATTMETAIFAYLGLFLFSHRYHWNIWHTIISILACCVSRGMMIPSLSLVANAITRIQQTRAQCRTQATVNKASSNAAGVVVGKQMQLVLWFAGLRGAMSFALVEHIPLYDSVSGEGTRLKPELKAMTSACIMFTVFVLGGYTYYLMEYLGMAPQGSTSALPQFELASLLNKNRNGDREEKRQGDSSENWELRPSTRSTPTTLRRQRPRDAEMNGT